MGSESLHAARLEREALELHLTRRKNMNSSRIEIPLALPTPHFDDERTVATARQVKPIGRARVTENWRKVRTLLPLILLATVCGALGAAGVNYYENRHTVNAIAQSSTNNSTTESKVEASPIAVAASTSPTPNLADKNNETEPADAKIEGTSVVVSTSTVPDPVSVRYAWAPAPTCNLYNREGLPASPFQSPE